MNNQEMIAYGKEHGHYPVVECALGSCKILDKPATSTQTESTVSTPEEVKEECSKGSGVMGQYGKTSLFVDGKWIDERVAVWTAANGPVPQGKAVGNSCYNKWCVTLSHLETFGKRF